ncbi:uncharacterized protein LOC141590190 [Silene latifolia]|uniref:uncharacterized protein LOC141590190 n=1 Tax=Silene latifolia TaxID=37657 RepID=UPI003D76B5A4
MNLFFCETSAKSSEVDIDGSDYADELKLWSNTLMGNVLGGRPTLKTVQEFVTKSWANIASPTVKYFKQRWFTFRFDSDVALNNVLKQGPWNVGHNILILKQWSPSFSLEMDRVAKVPVWILFPGLDPFLWTDKVMSKMANKIGKPLFADPATTSKEKLSFARVLVEVDVSQELPSHVVINTPHLGQYSQKVVYEWLPYYCKCCGKLGHTSVNCKRNKTEDTPYGSAPSSQGPVSQQKHVQSPQKSVATEIVPSDPLVTDILVSPNSFQILGENPEVDQVELGGGTSVSIQNDGLVEGRNVGSSSSQLGQRSSSHLPLSSALVSEMHQECPILSPGLIESPDPGGFVSLGGYSWLCFPSIKFPMKIASWNVRGLNCPLKQNVVRDFLTQNHLDVVALLETRVKIGNAPRILNTSFRHWDSICNYDHHYDGRIWLLYNPFNVTVSVHSIGDQWISYSVLHKVSSTSLNLTVVYGSNDAAERNALWTGLQAASTSNPWLVIGDFNVVRCPAEKLGPHPPILHEMMDFNSCLISCKVDDIAGTGADMTWTNKQDSLTRVWSKLDRALVNQQWIASFPTSHALFMESGLSDHSPVVVQVQEDIKTHKRFSFLNSCIQHPNYDSIVRDAWAPPIAGNPMFRLFTKLKKVKHALTCFHRENYSDLTGRVKAAKVQLKDCQQQLLQDPFSSFLIEAERDCLANYTSLKKAELGADNGPCVTEEDKLRLVQDITSSEIKAALFSIDSNSSPGVDGFSSGFFKSSWDIINGDFCAAIQNYARKALSPRCLIKVDIKKAFDYIQWDFLSQMLTSLGFPPIFSKWIMDCITNTWYSFKINGGIAGFFPGKSGIRQGDPLSPYLFVLSMEILSRYLRILCDQMNVSYHPKCSKLNLNHLVFADDLMIFVRGDVPSVVAVKDTLVKFALLSGLHANVDKTNIYFGGVYPELVSEIIQATGFSKGQFPFKYLGIPLSTSRIFVNMFDPLITKIQKKVFHWSSHALSYASKLQLISSVVFGLDNYWGASILLPVAITKRVEQLCRQFFSGIPDSGRKMVFKSWKSICSPWSGGGFNIKDLSSWNRSLLVKWLALLLALASSLWAKWQHAYVLKGMDIWCLQTKDSFSTSMKGILIVRDFGSHFHLHLAYDFSRAAPAQGDWTKGLSYSSIFPSHRITCSMAAQGQLATQDNIKKRGYQFANRCCFCQASEEYHDHLFFSCPFTAQVWSSILSWMSLPQFSSSLLHFLVACPFGSSKNNWKTHCFYTSLAAAVNQIWWERNQRLFCHKTTDVARILCKIKCLVLARLSIKFSQSLFSPLLNHLVP